MMLHIEEVLKYNQANNIHFFRITSKLIPLATHPDVLWDFTQQFKDELFEVGNFIKANKMRVDLHPDQFNVLNSTNQEVVKNTITTLEHHHQLLETMGLDNEILILHVGSGKEGKENSIRRFIYQFNLLPKHLKRRIVIENDDKIFNIQDVLKISEEIHIPIVFDYHHHRCNYIEGINELNLSIFHTWDNSQFIPKVHISSPKNYGLDRSHSDYIHKEHFINLLNIFKENNQDYDVMIEAKMKDMAMFKLIEDIKIHFPQFKWLDKTTLEL